MADIMNRQFLQKTLEKLDKSELIKLLLDRKVKSNIITQGILVSLFPEDYKEDRKDPNEFEWEANELIDTDPLSEDLNEYFEFTDSQELDMKDQKDKGIIQLLHTNVNRNNQGNNEWKESSSIAAGQIKEQVQIQNIKKEVNTEDIIETTDDSSKVTQLQERIYTYVRKTNSTSTAMQISQSKSFYDTETEEHVHNTSKNKSSKVQLFEVSKGTHYCCVPTCKKTIKPTFKFPNPRRNLDLFLKWKNAVNSPKHKTIDYNKIFARSYVCILHFNQNDFDCRKKLIKDRVPTQNLPKKNKHHDPSLEKLDVENSLNDYTVQLDYTFNK